ncbi:hypothetical protein OKW41_002353 [Paraburkholderia sp. UCT70]
MRSSPLFVTHRTTARGRTEPDACRTQYGQPETFNQTVTLTVERPLGPKRRTYARDHVDRHPPTWVAVIMLVASMSTGISRSSLSRRVLRRRRESSSRSLVVRLSSRSQCRDQLAKRGFVEPDAKAHRRRLDARMDYGAKEMYDQRPEDQQHRACNAVVSAQQYIGDVKCQRGQHHVAGDAYRPRVHHFTWNSLRRVRRFGRHR